VGRINLTHHRKFRRLSRALGSPALALGTLELLWLAAYEAADAFVGGAEDIADAVTWTGDPDVLVAALEAAGFVDPVGAGYAVHDLWDHVPKYVKLRWLRTHKGAPPDARPWHKTSSCVPLLGTTEPDPRYLPVPARPVEEQKEKEHGLSPASREKPVENLEEPNPRVLTRLAYELPPALLEADADEADKKAALKDLAVRYGCTFDATTITGALDHLARRPLWVRDADRHSPTRAPSLARRPAMRANR